MGKYTAYNQPFVDQQIQDHIDLALEVINQEIKGIVSMILVGGFGRAEGSVTIKDEKMTPVNDYDIYIILDHGLSVEESKLRQVMDIIEKKPVRKGFLFMKYLLSHFILIFAFLT